MRLAKGLSLGILGEHLVGDTPLVHEVDSVRSLGLVLGDLAWLDVRFCRVGLSVLETIGGLLTKAKWLRVLLVLLSL